MPIRFIIFQGERPTHSIPSGLQRFVWRTLSHHLESSLETIVNWDHYKDEREPDQSKNQNQEPDYSRAWNSMHQAFLSTLRHFWQIGETYCWWTSKWDWYWENIGKHSFETGKSNQRRDTWNHPVESVSDADLSHSIPSRRDRRHYQTDCRNRFWDFGSDHFTKRGHEDCFIYARNGNYLCIHYTGRDRRFQRLQFPR